MAQRRNQPPKRVIKGNCLFCEGHIEPEYKEISVLSKILTERGKIMGRGKTGLCSKHQRAVTREVKRARLVALLPFIVRA